MEGFKNLEAHEPQGFVGHHNNLTVIIKPSTYSRIGGRFHTPHSILELNEVYETLSRNYGTTFDVLIHKIYIFYESALGQVEKLDIYFINIKSFNNHVRD